MEFLNEANFDKKQYDTWLRRIHYDDRDVIMYENMLNFLWKYVVAPGELLDREGLLEEYTHWNLQMIDKCFYHLPHDFPYIHIRRAYQSLIYLSGGKLKEGLSQLSLMGENAFCNDGRAPKLFLSKEGKRYEPVSRLFLLYNYEKILRRCKEDAANIFREAYPYAFTVFHDGSHEEHDRFYEEQMITFADMIFYPEFERVYKTPWGPVEFYVYFDKAHGISIDKFCKMTEFCL